MQLLRWETFYMRCQKQKKSAVAGIERTMGLLRDADGRILYEQVWIRRSAR